MPSRMQRQRQRRIRVGATVALVGLFAIIAGELVAATGGSSSSDATTPTSTSTLPPTTTVPLDPAKLGPVGKELYDLVQAGRAGTYHVRFVLSGSGVPTDATAAVLEVWRSGGQVRQDTRLDQPTGTTRSADIAGPDGIVACGERPGSPMACQQVSPSAARPDDDYLAPVLAGLATAVVTARDDTVLDQPVRCFDISATDAAAAASLCLTAGGAPVRVDANDLHWEAEVADGTVDPSTFTPPAPVPGLPTTSTVP